MTDAEIIKALGLCSSEHLGCEDGCPYTMQACRGGDAVMKDALALIDRQKAEIEELTNAVELYGMSARVIALNLDEYCDTNLGYAEMIADASRKAAKEIERLEEENERFADIGKLYSEVRAEAIKEFAEILKKRTRFCSSIHGCNYIVFETDIDNLVEELTE